LRQPSSCSSSCSHCCRDTGTGAALVHGCVPARVPDAVSSCSLAWLEWHARRPCAAIPLPTHGAARAAAGGFAEVAAKSNAYRGEAFLP
jgi:hypothetical protein